MYSLEIAILARSLRSLVKILSNLTTGSDTFANSKYVATMSNNERKMDWF